MQEAEVNLDKGNGNLAATGQGMKTNQGKLCNLHQKLQ